MAQLHPDTSKGDPIQPSLDFVAPFRLELHQIYLRPIAASHWTDENRSCRRHKQILPSLILFCYFAVAIVKKKPKIFFFVSKVDLKWQKKKFFFWGFSVLKDPPAVKLKGPGHLSLNLRGKIVRKLIFMTFRTIFIQKISFKIHLPKISGNFHGPKSF